MESITRKSEKEKIKISQGDEKMAPIRKSISVENSNMEQKKMQELQNKIMEQRNNLALTKGDVPDFRKRQFIKKGIMGIIAGIGIAVFSKMTRGLQNVNFNDGTTAFDLQTAGNVSMPAQPAFLAFNTASDENVTGNGTLATVDFDSEVFDQGADFTADTFTAPVTGRYSLYTHIRIDGITSAADSIEFVLVTSNRSYRQKKVFTNGFGATEKFSISTLVDMDSGDTVTVTIQVAGESSDVVDISGSATSLNTCFSGKLEA